MKIPLPKYTHFGYEFLEINNQGQIHSGWDLNKGAPSDDLGEPVLAMTDGEVVFSEHTAGGWGKLIVIYHPKIRKWTRYGHLDMLLVADGDSVKEGEEIGACGNTGASTSPHLHFDLIIKELSYWEKYTSGMSESHVLEYYRDGLAYIENYTEPEAEIVKWHKKNKVIEEWSQNPTEEEIKDGWIAYKILKLVKNGDVDKMEFPF